MIIPESLRSRKRKIKAKRLSEERIHMNQPTMPLFLQIVFMSVENKFLRIWVKLINISNSFCFDGEKIY